MNDFTTLSDVVETPPVASLPANAPILSEGLGAEAAGGDYVAALRAEHAEQIRDLEDVLAQTRTMNRLLKQERDDALLEREWDNRAISIARHYGHEDSRAKHEDGRIRPALVLERAVAVAIDAWCDGNRVTISLCRMEVEQWVALVSVENADTTAFSIDDMGDAGSMQVQEVWLSSQVLAALDAARRKDGGPTK